MIRLFVPGQTVPEWLFKMEQTGVVKPMTLTFADVVVIWAYKGSYRVVSSSFGRSVILGAGECEELLLTGQSPSGGKGVLKIYRSILDLFRSND